MSNEPAGYIVYTDEAIYGSGSTAREALADAREWLDPDCDPETDDDVRIMAASVSLLAQIEQRGGAIAWGRLGNVACTNAEEEAGRLDVWEKR